MCEEVSCVYEAHPGTGPRQTFADFCSPLRPVALSLDRDALLTISVATAPLNAIGASPKERPERQGMAAGEKEATSVNRLTAEMKTKIMHTY